MIASVGEDLSHPCSAGTALPAEHVQAPRDGRRGRETTVDRVLDHRGEVFVVEGTGEVNDRASWTGEPDQPEHSTIVEVHGPSMHDHQVGLE